MKPSWGLGVLIGLLVYVIAAVFNIVPSSMGFIAVILGLAVLLVALGK